MGKMRVQLNKTTIIGSESTCKLTGHLFTSYLGIPYAKPPIGELRFQPPQKPDDMEEEFEANLEADDCIQTNRIKTTGTVGSEDCLYLNVYVPKNAGEETSLKPVLVFVHGGAFMYMSGSPTNFSPDYLMSHNIIVVTMNYRLHVLGFLDLALPDCPGNMGLLDIIMAFKWVKENIIHFGGDPENVTAFGNSSGAFAIHLLTMSPLTKDEKLFNKMVLISGNAFTGPLCRGNSQDFAFELGYRLGYRGKNRETLLRFLKTVPADELTEKMNAYYNDLKTENKGNMICFPFPPTIQKYTEGVVLPASPAELFNSAVTYPTISGLMSKEGLLPYYFEPFLMKYLVEEFETVLQNIIPMSDETKKKVTQLLINYYYNGKRFDYNGFPESVDLLTDIYWLRHFYNALRLLIESENSPTYLFEFKYDGGLNCYKKYYPLMTRWIEGATHDDILGYCLPFKYNLGSQFSNKKDIRIVNHVCTFLCNFMKTGNPNGNSIKTEWRQTNATEPCYLQISEFLKMTKGKIYEDRLKLWQRIQKIIEGSDDVNEKYE